MNTAKILITSAAAAHKLKINWPTLAHSSKQPQQQQRASSKKKPAGARGKKDRGTRASGWTTTTGAINGRRHRRAQLATTMRTKTKPLTRVQLLAVSLFARMVRRLSHTSRGRGKRDAERARERKPAAEPAREC